MSDPKRSRPFEKGGSDGYDKLDLPQVLSGAAVINDQKKRPFEKGGSDGYDKLDLPQALSGAAVINDQKRPFEKGGSDGYDKLDLPQEVSSLKEQGLKNTGLFKKSERETSAINEIEEQIASCKLKL